MPTSFHIDLSVSALWRTASHVSKLGYARSTVDHVDVTLRDLDGVLANIRHSPYTWKPGTNKNALRRRFADRYLHLSGFDNGNYKDEPVNPADPEEGVDHIRQLRRASILLSGCPVHRRNATDPRSQEKSLSPGQYPSTTIRHKGPSAKHLFGIQTR